MEIITIKISIDTEELSKAIAEGIGKAVYVEVVKEGCERHATEVDRETKQIYR